MKKLLLWLDDKPWWIRAPAAIVILPTFIIALTVALPVLLPLHILDAWISDARCSENKRSRPNPPML